MSTSGPQGSPLRRIVIAVVALLVVAGMVLPAAFGHSVLISASPADGESLPDADEVVLTFNEAINPDFVQIRAEGPNGSDFADGDPVVKENVLTQSIVAVASGEHSFTYRVVSADGHPISGTITFTLTGVAAQPTEEPTDEPAEPTTEQAPTTEAPTTEDTTTGAPATDEATTEASAPTDSDNGDGFAVPLWLIIAAVLAVAAGLLYAAFGRRRPEH